MSKLKIGRIMLGVCQTNCYFIYEDGREEVWFFDPADRGDYIFEALKKKGFGIAGIFLTHGHFDHIWGVEELKKCSGAKLYALDKEKELCMDSSMNVSKAAGRACTVTPDIYVKDNEEITLAGMSARVIATPGHTGGSCCYYFEEDKILISGDTLFQESVGRTDFPSGSMSKLVRSIKEKLFTLPQDVKVYPGHGEPTTIGHEMKHNPFL